MMNRNNIKCSLCRFAIIDHDAAISVQITTKYTEEPERIFLCDECAKRISKEYQTKLQISIDK